jgi:hypothetical protein
MRCRKFARPTVYFAATALAWLPCAAWSQTTATTEVLCPEQAEPFTRIDYAYGVDRKPSFICWYKSLDPGSKLAETPVFLDPKGKCWLKNADQIADMTSPGKSGFTAGRQSCDGDRTRCAVTCRSE